MSTKTKTTAAAAIAALALPTVAIAEHRDGHTHGKDRAGERSSERSVRGDDHRGKHTGWAKRGRSFVVRGVDATGVTVTDGKLAGPITLDPVSANKGARVLLELTKAELRGEDTVTFGEAGDEVRVKYINLPEGTAPAPTDVVQVFGKISRSDGELNITKIWVKRPDTDEQDD